jgi:hypothetical protein
MAAKFMLATKTKFAYKNYKSSYSKKSLKAVIVAKNSRWRLYFLATFSRSSHIRQELKNGKIFAYS